MAAETFAEITDVEHSKLWQTLRLLVFKPGQLTREYWSGRRKRFLGPVKLYLVVFALSLVLYSIHQPTAVFDVRPLAARVEAKVDRLPVEQREEVMKIWQSRAHGGLPRGSTGKLPRFLDELANERGLPTPQFAQQVNSRWQSYTSVSQVIYPLFVALALKLLLLRRRLYFAQHLIFALHFLAFLFLSTLVLWPFYVLFGAQIGDIGSGSVPLKSVALVWRAVYLVLALRRAYAEQWLLAIIKGAVVLLIYGATWALFVTAALALAIALT
jgi:Protein of unknown function (DUF3667)